ncbi:MAG: hypothetical protein U5N58_00180 [Actinomycetota bacterium]|nr:hypothetical protein [Actinomycetota bacterium]
MDVAGQIGGVELNLSCPNVDKGGMAFCSYPEDIKKLHPWSSKY